MLKRRFLAFLLMTAMLLTSFAPAMKVSAAWGEAVHLLTVKEGTSDNTATKRDAPDGQTAWSLNTGTSKNGGPWDNLFTPSLTPPMNLVAYQDGYFVFEMYIPNESFKKMQGNN